MKFAQRYCHSNGQADKKKQVTVCNETGAYVKLWSSLCIKLRKKGMGYQYTAERGLHLGGVVGGGKWEG